MRAAFVDDPYEVVDERFAPLQGDSRLERLFDGCRWTEGPVYFPAGRYLLFSDIPNDRIMRWDECTGASACSPTVTRASASTAPTTSW